VNAHALLEYARAAGVVLSPEPGGRLAVEGPPDVLDALLPAFRDHKAALLRLLATPDPDPTPPPLSDADAEALREAREERAAILEYDAGMDRAAAEAEAWRAIRAWRYLLRTPGRPDVWCAFIDPHGCAENEARRDLEARYGPGRVLAVAPASRRFDA
jgi:hypothetical protein